MFTEEELKQAQEQEASSAQLYFQGIIDFIKWTSTLGVAAILWVGNALTSLDSLALYLAISSLVALIISLIVAVIVVYRVLTAWSKEWVVASETHSFLLMKKLKFVEEDMVSDEKEKEHAGRLLKAVDATKPFHQPTSFNLRVVGHVGLLTIGLVLYALAQAASSL